MAIGITTPKVGSNIYFLEIHVGLVNNTIY